MSVAFFFSFYVDRAPAGPRELVGGTTGAASVVAVVFLHFSLFGFLFTEFLAVPFMLFSGNRIVTYASLIG